MTGLLQAVRREAEFISRSGQVIGRINASAKSGELLPEVIERTVDAHKDRPAFIFEGRTITFDAFEALANQVASWAREQRILPGETVALFMLNRPEYVAIWYGLSKVGVITALINNQLSGESLAHCVAISHARHAILDKEIGAPATGAASSAGKGCVPWSFGGAIKGAKDFRAALEGQPTTRPDPAIRALIQRGDVALKAYTSGTTGLPKAAKLTHSRASNFLTVFAAAYQARPEDRMLLTLPLYHSTGGMCGLGPTLCEGAATILEKKFSATRFWDSAVDNGATLFIYVGELCRYLVAAPENPKEKKHSIRAVSGNGMRPDVWERFVERFGIANVYEFYGSTEGNISLMNINGRLGAVGRVPPYAKSRFNVDIVKFDNDRQEAIRGPDGLCERAALDEPGEVIGEIRPQDPRYHFDGYAADKKQSEAKILRNVFKRGDAWFRSGDLMRRDGLGYYYFVDRIGDTFRWRAENVSTMEVAEVLGGFDGVDHVNVYGVEVPGYDGRAGMAALVAADDLDLKALCEHLTDELPDYARPVFLRMQSDAAVTSTGTFKAKKVDLITEGFDPSTVDEPLYVLDPRTCEYRALDKTTYKAIADGGFRL